MEGRQRADGAPARLVVEPAAAGAHDAFAGRQQRLRRGIAERHQHIRIHQLDLALDERQADLRLLRRRRAVAGRPPGNHVGDVGGGAVEAYGSYHQIEQLAAAPDEGQPLDVLVAARCLADEHDARLRIAVGENQPCRRVLQRAAVKALHQLAQRLQASARCVRPRAPRRSRCRARVPPRRASPPVRRPAVAPRPEVAARGAGGGASNSARRSIGSSASAQSTPASR